MPQSSFNYGCSSSYAEGDVFGGLDALLGWCILGGLTLATPPGGGV